MEERFYITHEFESGILEKRHGTQILNTVNPSRSMHMVTSLAWAFRTATIPDPDSGIGQEIAPRRWGRSTVSPYVHDVGVELAKYRRLGNVDCAMASRRSPASAKCRQ